MVSRDYKRSKARREPFSGWTGLLIGGIAGFGVGLALYLFDPRATPQSGGATTPEPASARESTGDEPAEAPAEAKPKKKKAAAEKPAKADDAAPAEAKPEKKKKEKKEK